MACFICPQDDSVDHSLGTMTMSMSMSGTNLYEAARLSGGSSIIENLQSQLKLRDGEIAQLQVGAFGGNLMWLITDKMKAEFMFFLLCYHIYAVCQKL